MIENLIKGKCIIRAVIDMRSQGTFEYMLLLGGVIIVVLILANSLLQAGQQGATTAGQSIQQTTSTLQKEINQQLNQLGG